MKVKEYLIKRIEELERDLREVRSENTGLRCANVALNKRTDELIDRVDQLTTEREHIKEIIACNIGKDISRPNHMTLEIIDFEDDFKTLMSILNIKSEQEAIENKDRENMSCVTCKHEEKESTETPCDRCTYQNSYWERKEETDAQTSE